MDELAFFTIVLDTLAGLVLFLLGVEHLAQGFEELAGQRARRLLTRFTANRWAGVATGAVATTVLDSSSVTIVMVIALVQAGVMSFSHALGVVLGANIGTTIGSQVIAFEIQRFAPIALIAGLGLRFIRPWRRSREASQVLLGAGLLFFGLDYLGQAMSPMKVHTPFVEWMAALGEQPAMGVLAGCVFTLVIQSSSATVGTAIIMASEGLLPLSSGIAIMLGAEIGTVSTALIASVGRSREAIRIAVFHLLFNVGTVALGLLFIHPLTGFAQALTPGAGVARHLANAHVLFNVLGVLLVIGFLPLIARGLERLIPSQRVPRVQAPIVVREAGT